MGTVESVKRIPEVLWAPAQSALRVGMAVLFS